MSATLELLMAVFPDRPRAEVTIDALKQMDKRGEVEILDAALVEKDVSGKVHISEVKELTSRKGASRGAAIGGAIGLIFPPSILASAALGAAAGGLIGKLRDTGLKTADLKDAGAQLTPGQTGVVAVVEATWAERLSQALAGQERLARLVLEADEAAVLVGDPTTGDFAGAAWTTIPAEASADPAGAPPTPSAEASSPPPAPGNA
jgi:uncharacterized membrane protein